MNEERRKSERRVPPAVVEFAVEERQQLLEKIADQAREIERLKAGQESLILVRDDYKRQAGEYRTLWSKAVVKPRPHGLVLPERDDVIRKAVGMCNRIPGSTTWNAAEYAYDEFVARLNSSPVSAGDDALTCDYCGAETEDPWHGSGMLDGAESRHIHACDGCRHMLPSVSAGGVDERASLATLERFVETVRECYNLASSYSGSLDGVDEHGGDDHEDPICAVFHRLYYAMFDGDKALDQARAALTASAPNYRTYTTTPGEAVAGIALRQLGDESRWVEIRDLNAHAFPDIGPHDYYPVGTELRLPDLSAPNHGEQVREWVPVSERTPGNTGSPYQVAAICKKQHVQGSAYEGQGRRGIYQDWVIRNWPGNFTHWLPLPAAPAAGSQKEQGE